VALSKVDAVPAGRLARIKTKLAKAAGATPLYLSAVSGEGVEAALRLLAREIDAAKAPDPHRVPAVEAGPWRP
jgi:GTP-binding protein